MFVITCVIAIRQMVGNSLLDVVAEAFGEGERARR